MTPRETPAASREWQGVLLCVFAACSFAAMVVFAKLAYAAGVETTTLLTVRFALGASLLGAVAARRGLMRVGWRDLLAVLAMGSTVYSAETGLVFASLERIGASMTELLIFSYPAVVMLAAVGLGRESFSVRRTVALAVASAGVVLVLAGGDAGSFEPVGVSFALGAALLYAIYVLVVAGVGERVHALALAALTCAGAAVAFAAAGAVSGRLDFGMSAAGWGWSLAVLASTVAALAAFLASIARLGPSRASILGMLEPPLAVGLAFLVFGERLGPVQLAGGALVTVAAVVLQLPLGARRARGAGRPT